MTTTHQVRIAVLWLSIIVSSLVACSKREIELDEADPTMIKAITEKLIEASATSKSEKEVLWNPGDEIAVFSGELSGKFESTLKKKPSSAAVFRGDLGLEAWPEELDIWAVYPYSEEASFDGETITTVLPSEQIARDGEFGKDMNLAIAHSNTSTLQFYNVGGGLRFSVTEDGIKKVIFEGLSGEIISGKVKIGFSEDGVPEIRKVVSGSQFITILPPDGQETFQKDTWYYIVVIPGSLEHGYKMRFYKDSDYARKVSNNALKIKRSFYRDLENADDGIEYDVQTIHFPETKEEWKESLQLSYSIADEFDEIENAIINSGTSIAIEDLRDRVSLIEGVIKVDVNDSKNTLMVMQRDSIWVNYFLFNDTPDEIEANVNEAMSSQFLSLRKTFEPRSSYKTHSTLQENYYGRKGKALILSPYRSSFTVSNESNAEWHETQWKTALEIMGFNPNSIIVKPNKKADILQFKGDSLSQYDFIIVNTHGGTGYRMREPEGTIVRQQTILSSSTVYDEKTIEDILSSGKLRSDQIALGKPDGEKEFHLGMTTGFLENTSFDSTFVLLGACESAKILDNRNNGSMVQTLLDKGCKMVSGYRETIATPVDLWMTTLLLESMLEGMSFQDAAKYLHSSQMMYDYDEHLKGNVIYQWWLEDIRSIDLSYIDHTLFDYFPKNSSPFFMKEWPPLVSAFKDDDVYLQIVPEAFIDHSISVNAEKKGFTFEYSHKDVFDIYVDDNLVRAAVTSDSSAPCVLHNLEPGEHKSYYLTRIMEGNTVIASYKSKEGSFIVAEENVTVNSISLDKSSLELSVGCTATLKATILPDNATNKSVSWSSSNPSVATVSPTGEVKGIAKGNAIITVKTEDGGKTATCNVTVKESSAFDVVDLGLSVNWASSNIGATKPEESGTYYAWGETSGKTNFSWENYKWLDPSSYTLTKYCGDPEYGYNGYVDSKTKLDNADDVARTILGDGWRMPTRAEFEELFNPKNCTVVWEELNGVNVVKLTSLKNGKVLYLPAVGIYDEDTLYYSGTYGAYWTSTFSPDDPTNAFFFTFDSSTHYSDTGYRYRGCPVRAVKVK